MTTTLRSALRDAMVDGMNPRFQALHFDQVETIMNSTYRHLIQLVFPDILIQERYHNATWNFVYNIIFRLKEEEAKGLLLIIPFLTAFAAKTVIIPDHYYRNRIKAPTNQHLAMVAATIIQTFPCRKENNLIYFEHTRLTMVMDTIMRCIVAGREEYNALTKEAIFDMESIFTTYSGEVDNHLNTRICPECGGRKNIIHGNYARSFCRSRRGTTKTDNRRHPSTTCGAFFLDVPDRSIRADRIRESVEPINHVWAEYTKFVTDNTNPKVIGSIEKEDDVIEVPDVDIDDDVFLSALDIEEFQDEMFE